MAKAEMEKMIGLEELRLVDEVICERLGEIVTVMIPWVLNESFQDYLEARSIMGNNFDSALVRSIKRRRLDDLIREHLSRIKDREYGRHRGNDD